MDSSAAAVVDVSPMTHRDHQDDPRPSWISYTIR